MLNKIIKRLIYTKPPKLEGIPFTLTEKDAQEAYYKWSKRYTNFIITRKAQIRVYY